MTGTNSGQQQQKVVNLHSYGQDQHGIAQGEAKRLLSECRDRVAEYLSGAVAATMEQIDDTLFERADKATSDIEQRIYFDAMREVRLRRSSVESKCRTLFQERFVALVRVKPRASGHSAAEADGGSQLSLLAHDDLEESLAATNMATKVRNLCHQELFELEKRLLLLLRREEMKNEDNPLGPETICSTFRDACGEVQVDVKAKLIVLKLFDKLAIPGMATLYRELNQFLVKNRVLPVIRHQVRRSAYRRPPAANSLAAPAGESGLDLPLFGPAGQIDPHSALHQLVGAGAPVAGTLPVGLATPGDVAGLTASAMEAVMGTLSAMQWGDRNAQFEGMPDPALVAQGTVNILRDIKAVPGLQPLVNADSVTIDIVALIFDHILDNRDVEPALKALIGRLQIPVLKVAILDKSFFTSRQHPARRLLDELARAAKGWDEREPRGDGSLYGEVEGIVETVIRDFADDVALFEEMTERLTAFLATEQSRAERYEARTTKALEGEERVMMAKVIVRDEIDRRVNKQQPPAPVAAFLGEHWFTVMLLYFLREGDEGSGWRRSQELMDTLLWSVQPKHTDRERQRLIGALGWLLEGLQEGMEMASVPELRRQGFLAELKSCHSRALREGRANQPAYEVAVQRQQAEARRTSRQALGAYLGEIEEQLPMETSPTDEVSMEDVLQYADFTEPCDSAEQDEQSPEVRRARYQELMESLRAEHEQMEVEEITIGEPGPEAECDDEHSELVARLQKGTWVEFTAQDGATVRGKLSWISPITGTYLFTNRQGVKVADRTSKGLALEFRRGSAKIIETQSLLDQALSSLLNKDSAQTLSPPS